MAQQQQQQKQQKQKQKQKQQKQQQQKQKQQKQKQQKQTNETRASSLPPDLDSRIISVDDVEARILAISADNSPRSHTRLFYACRTHRRPSRRKTRSM